MAHTPRDDRELRILILMAVGRDARLAEEALQRVGLACQICGNLDELRREIGAGAGAVLVAHEALPLGPSARHDWFGDEPLWSQLPLVVLTGAGTPRPRSAALRRFEHRKNVSFLERPVPKLTLVSTLLAAIESRRRQYFVRDLVAELEAGVRQRDEYLAMLAHELRNPLAPIQSGLDVLRIAGDNRALTERTLSIIERQVAHMTRLINDLLDVSRVTRGKITLRRRPIDLREVAQQATESLGASGKLAGRRLSLGLPHEPVVVDVDQDRIVQILANLLDNAVKYTDPEGRVEVTVARAAADATLSVRDDGIGLPADAADRIFQLFAQGDGPRGGGLGLGLTLSRALVELHGGAIEAYSAGLGQGTEFTVRLPLVEHARIESSAGAHPGNGPLAGHRVLVVDDNRDVADATGALLELLGVGTEIVYDGASALERFARFRPTVVLLDLGMPGMDGLEVAQEIRRHEGSASTLLVAVTGWSNEKDARSRAKAAGFDRYLTKPVPVAALRSVLEAHPA